MEIAHTVYGDDQLERAQERLRYRVLEYVYIQTGERCERAVSLEQMVTQLGLSAKMAAQAVQYLVSRCMLRDRPAHRHEVCITPDGLDYIQTGAGMRRTVRD